MTEKSYRISSNLTLFLKLGFPIFWFVFFGAITMGLLLSNSEDGGISSIPGFKWTWLGFFILFFLLFYFTLFRLKRVELSNDSIYVSNYFQTFKYAFSDVEKINALDFGILLILIVRLRYKGKMGKRIPFIASKTRLNQFLDESKFDQLTSALDK